MRRSFRVLFFLLAFALGLGNSDAGSVYSVEQAVAAAKKQNAEILMAAKQLEAAREDESQIARRLRERRRSRGVARRGPLVLPRASRDGGSLTHELDAAVTRPTF